MNSNKASRKASKLSSMDNETRVEIDLLPLQSKALKKIDSTRFGVMICHRRFGKTTLAILRLCRNATQGKSSYRGAYIAPTYKQAKDVAWDLIKKIAFVCGAKVNESELSVAFTNGAKIRLYGAENPDSLRGLNICDAVFDEVAQMPITMWTDIILPMLLANHGNALFIGTPQGHNTLWKIWEAAKQDKDWTALMYRVSETHLLSDEDLARAKASMPAEKFEQEYECSFTAALIGAYYGKILEESEREGRICNVPYVREVPVITAWDLGFSDSTSIWFAQKVGQEMHIIDYYEATGVGLEHYVNVIQNKGYFYSEHLLPHDAGASELGTGTTRLETLRRLGLLARVLPMTKVDDGINAVRLLLPRCWFDASKCQQGVEALKLYQREWDDKIQDFRPRPLHDWTSHAADAFRYLAMGVDSPITPFKPLHKPQNLRVV